MRKNLILSTALFNAYLASPQNSDPWHATGNIGIGTNTPATHFLHSFQIIIYHSHDSVISESGIRFHY